MSGFRHDMDALAADLALEAGLHDVLVKAARKAKERSADWLCESCKVIVRQVRCQHCGKSEEEAK